MKMIFEMEMKEKMTAGQLIDMLLDGNTLVRDNAMNDESEYLYCRPDHLNKPYFYLQGWGSCLGNVKDRLIDIINNPENWRAQSNKGNIGESVLSNLQSVSENYAKGLRNMGAKSTQNSAYDFKRGAKWAYNQIVLHNQTQPK